MKAMLIRSVCFSLVMGLSAVTFAQDKPAQEGAKRGPGEKGAAKSADPAQRAEKLFARLDKNQDGAIGADEMQGKIKDRIMQADMNSDGKIEKAEWATAMKSLAEAGGKAAGGKKPGAGDGKGKMQDPAARVKQLMGRLDKNKDGKISADEVPAEMAERIGKWDTSGDGVIDQTEITALIAKMGQNGRGEGQPGGAQKERGKKRNAERGGNSVQPQEPKRPGGA